ncbi:UvrB/UvrC protein [Ammonifex degensii KC4]|uniref:UvrB/UvrC protein n=1 Tax=Ammonifex degensii (strain DSM 10501 / KC4) TaxID=429009 RepID=C9R9Q0_AMMDK|nr:UvrB/UvrC motif-containing protein [Ammonifex degensii]ACX53029.1 UvrB/UvrC protein [Ammonifex degensii KC4]
MLCERCHKRPATVHYTEIVNNQKKELHLCEECAREMGAGSLFPPQFPFHSLLSGLFFPVEEEMETRKEARCPRCGLTEREFAARGLLGCPQCYGALRPAVEQVLRRVHGVTRHTGKAPRRQKEAVGKLTEIERLKQELAEAVRREEYERAAELRDRIRELEKKTGGKTENGSQRNSN